MPKDKSFHDYVVNDLLADVEGITSKAMFGGWGIYKNGKIFAIIVEGELYFKVTDKNRKDYEEMGSHPFTYKKGDKEYTMSYWLIPPDVLEDKDRLHELIEKSLS